MAKASMGSTSATQECVQLHPRDRSSKVWFPQQSQNAAEEEVDTGTKQQTSHTGRERTAADRTLCTGEPPPPLTSELGRPCRLSGFWVYGLSNGDHKINTYLLELMCEDEI